MRNWVRGPVLACWVWEIRAIALPAGFTVSWEAERDVPWVSAGCGSLLQPPWGGGWAFSLASKELSDKRICKPPQPYTGHYC